MSTNPEKKEAMFTVDPYDIKGMIDVMDKYGDNDTMYFGKNENKEDVSISVFNDRISVTTFQSNGWIRENVYWRDGTSEELFNGKWSSKDE